MLKILSAFAMLAGGVALLAVLVSLWMILSPAADAARFLDNLVNALMVYFALVISGPAALLSGLLGWWLSGWGPSGHAGIFPVVTGIGAAACGLIAYANLATG